MDQNEGFSKIQHSDLVRIMNSFIKKEFCSNNQLGLMQNCKGQETYVEKVLEVENESTGIICRFRMNILYLPSTRQINLSRAICQLHSRGNLFVELGLHIEHSHFFYEDYQNQIFKYFGTYPFTSPILLKYQNFPNTVIKIRYKRITNPDSPKYNQKQRLQANRKPKERTIGEVIEYVRKWRELHQMIDQRGKRLYTLETAARELGINRKTLDDYADQLKKGEFFSFDFERYKHEKIGFLRQFIKEKKKEMKLLQNTDNYWALSDSDDERRRKKRRGSDSDY